MLVMVQPKIILSLLNCYTFFLQLFFQYIYQSGQKNVLFVSLRIPQLCPYVPIKFTKQNRQVLSFSDSIKKWMSSSYCLLFLRGHGQGKWSNNNPYNIFDFPSFYDEKLLWNKMIIKPFSCISSNWYYQMTISNSENTRYYFVWQMLFSSLTHRLGDQSIGTSRKTIR